MNRPCFTPFSALTAAAVNREQHAHTILTDGRDPATALAAAAQACGLAELALTEHVRRESDIFDAYCTAVDALPVVAGLCICRGAEVKICSSAGDLDLTAAQAAQLDFIVAAVHRLPQGNTFVPADHFPRDEAIARETELLLAAAQRAEATVLAHPGGMAIRYFGQYPLDRLAQVLAAAKERGVAVEINSAYLPADHDSWLAVFREVDPLVAIASDAHGTEEVGRCRDFLNAALRLS